MARLIYLAIASLDGYVEDEQGKFDWVARMKRCMPSSTTSRGPGAPTCTGGA